MIREIINTHRCDELGALGLEVFLFLEYQGRCDGGGRCGGAQERRGFVVVVGVHDVARVQWYSEGTQACHTVTGSTLGGCLWALSGCHTTQGQRHINTVILDQAPQNSIHFLLSQEFKEVQSVCRHLISLYRLLCILKVALCRIYNFQTLATPSGSSKEDTVAGSKPHRKHNYQCFTKNPCISASDAHQFFK